MRGFTCATSTTCSHISPGAADFDPYGLYPGGQNTLTGPFWDYCVGSIAWIAGTGSPSDYLTDEVGAWLPAIFGALLPMQNPGGQRIRLRVYLPAFYRSMAARLYFSTAAGSIPERTACRSS
jgi:hypothetical protein